MSVEDNNASQADSLMDNASSIIDNILAVINSVQTDSARDWGIEGCKELPANATTPLKSHETAIATAKDTDVTDVASFDSALLDSSFNLADYGTSTPICTGDNGSAAQNDYDSLIESSLQTNSVDSGKFDDAASAELLADDDHKEEEEEGEASPFKLSASGITYTPATPAQADAMTQSIDIAADCSSMWMTLDLAGEVKPEVDESSGRTSAGWTEGHVEAHRIASSTASESTTSSLEDVLASDSAGITSGIDSISSSEHADDHTSLRKSLLMMSLSPTSTTPAPDHLVRELNRAEPIDETASAVKHNAASDELDLAVISAVLDDVPDAPTITSQEGSKARRRLSSRVRWTQEEDDILENLRSSLQLSEAVASFVQQYPSRSKPAVYSHLTDLARRRRARASEPADGPSSTSSQSDVVMVLAPVNTVATNSCYVLDNASHVDKEAAAVDDGTNIAEEHQAAAEEALIPLVDTQHMAHISPVPRNGDTVDVDVNVRTMPCCSVEGQQMSASAPVTNIADEISCSGIEGSTDGTAQVESSDTIPTKRSDDTSTDQQWTNGEDRLLLILRNVYNTQATITVFQHRYPHRTSAAIEARLTTCDVALMLDSMNESSPVRPTTRQRPHQSLPSSRPGLTPTEDRLLILLHEKHGYSKAIEEFQRRGYRGSVRSLQMRLNKLIKLGLANGNRPKSGEGTPAVTCIPPAGIPTEGDKLNLDSINESTPLLQGTDASLDFTQSSEQTTENGESQALEPSHSEDKEISSPTPLCDEKVESNDFGTAGYVIAADLPIMEIVPGINMNCQSTDGRDEIWSAEEDRFLSALFAVYCHSAAIQMFQLRCPGRHSAQSVAARYLQLRSESDDLDRPSSHGLSVVEQEQNEQDWDGVGQSSSNRHSSQETENDEEQSDTSDMEDESVVLGECQESRKRKRCGNELRYLDSGGQDESTPVRRSARFTRSRLATANLQLKKGRATGNKAAPQPIERVVNVPVIVQSYYPVPMALHALHTALSMFSYE